MPTNVRTEDELKPGDFYEDCFYHPCLCIGTDMGMVEGISLVDGSFRRQCGIPQCSVRKLTFEEAVIWRMYGPPDLAPENEMSESQKYWIKDEKKGAKILAPYGRRYAR
jgi:hypothetical protein